jgi:Kef-type K+ transport system membrane component KefB
METQLMSLAVIMLVAFLAPLVASAIPGKPIPEVVFLVFAGALLGPNMADVIATEGQALTMVSDLGLAFLFLMAGYEIEPKDFLSKTGLHATLSWVASFAVALALAWLLEGSSNATGAIAFAITLTTTAYGTLGPIMRERGITGTRVGRAVTTYGSLGELLPVLAMAFLLSSRSPAATAITLAAFLALCVLVALVPQLARRFGSRAWRFLNGSAGMGSRPMVRMTVLILVFLVAVSAMFELDLVLGAFAAGFIMRAIFPDGHEQIEDGVESIGNGFLIPAFFVISGASIDLAAAFSDPLLLVGDVLLMVLVRGGMVALSLRVNPDTRDMTWRESFSTAAYCTMALPLIVAVTSVAVSSGAMTQEISSTLVTAGALTVLVIPIVTSLVRVTSDAIPAIAQTQGTHAAGGATAQDHHLTPAEFAHRRLEEFQLARDEFDDVHRHLRGGKYHMSSMEYLAVADASLRAARLSALNEIVGAAAEAQAQPKEVREARLASLERAARKAMAHEPDDVREARLRALAAIARAAAGAADAAADRAEVAREASDAAGDRAAGDDAPAGSGRAGEGDRAAGDDAETGAGPEGAAGPGADEGTGAGCGEAGGDGRRDAGAGDPAGAADASDAGAGGSGGEGRRP